MSARVSRPCKDRPELEAMIEAAKGREPRQGSLVEEVANVIGYGIDVAGADIDTVARNAIRVVLKEVMARVERAQTKMSAPDMYWGAEYALRGIGALARETGTSETGLTP